MGREVAWGETKAACASRHPLNLGDGGAAQRFFVEGAEDCFEAQPAAQLPPHHLKASHRSKGVRA